MSIVGNALQIQRVAAARQNIGHALGVLVGLWRLALRVTGLLKAGSINPRIWRHLFAAPRFRAGSQTFFATL